MKHEIEITMTIQKHPPIKTYVIIAGGIGFWDGRDWISATGCDYLRRIDWPVKWWTPLISIKSEDM